MFANNVEEPSDEGQLVMFYGYYVCFFRSDMHFIFTFKGSSISEQGIRTDGIGNVG